jgi:hypothetical protein
MILALKSGYWKNSHHPEQKRELQSHLKIYKCYCALYETVWLRSKQMSFTGAGFTARFKSDWPRNCC